MGYKENCRVQNSDGMLGTVVDMCNIQEIDEGADENSYALLILWDNGSLSMKESTCKDIKLYEEAV